MSQEAKADADAGQRVARPNLDLAPRIALAAAALEGDAKGLAATAEGRQAALADAARQLVGRADALSQVARQVAEKQLPPGRGYIMNAYAAVKRAYFDAHLAFNAVAAPEPALREAWALTERSTSRLRGLFER